MTAPVRPNSFQPGNGWALSTRKAQIADGVDRVEQAMFRKAQERAALLAELMGSQGEFEDHANFAQLLAFRIRHMEMPESVDE